MKREKRKEKSFRLALQRVLEGPVELFIHDNTHVFLNARFRKKKWFVRLHWIFLKAPSAMPKHLARYILTRDRESSKVIDRYIEKRWDWVRHPLPPIRTKGKYFDLQNIFDRLNRRYLQGKVGAKITWGSSKNRRAYEQMQMGSYSTSRNLITIHPKLDQKFIPRFVVEATVFHEMCHALVPIQEKNGRKQIHPPAFKKMEERYVHLERAKEWEEEHFSKLLKRSSS